MPLPNFVIAGERRSGTTSLYRWLEPHPEIYLYPKPDMDYFIEEEVAGARSWHEGPADAERWEATHTPSAYSALFDGAPPSKLIGQKDADLLFWRPAQARAARYLPSARFVYVMRHPVVRCWSHYWNEVGKGRETLSFEQAIATEQERIARSDYARDHLSYVTRGFYDETLTDFYRHVPAQRVLVLTLEEMHADPEGSLKRVCTFLDVTPIAPPPKRAHNANQTTTPQPWAAWPGVRLVDRVYTRVTDSLIRRVASEREQRERLRLLAGLPFRKPAAKLRMSDDVRAELWRTYLPHIEKLSAMLGRPLSEWRP